MTLCFHVLSLTFASQDFDSDFPWRKLRGNVFLLGVFLSHPVGNFMFVRNSPICNSVWSGFLPKNEDSLVGVDRNQMLASMIIIGRCYLNDSFLLSTRTTQVCDQLFYFESWPSYFPLYVDAGACEWRSTSVLPKKTEVVPKSFLSKRNIFNLIEKHCFLGINVILKKMLFYSPHLELTVGQYVCGTSLYILIFHATQRKTLPRLSILAHIVFIE